MVTKEGNAIESAAAASVEPLFSRREIGRLRLVGPVFGVSIRVWRQVTEGCIYASGGFAFRGGIFEVGSLGWR
jgi:hypothetical protein